MAHIGQEFSLGTVRRFSRTERLALLGGVTFVEVGNVQAYTHRMKCGDHAIEFVRLARLAALQAERLRRLAKVVASDKPCDCREVSRNEPRENVNDEKRNEKRVGRLAHQDQERGLRQFAVETGERCLDVQGAEHAWRAVDAIRDGKFARYDRVVHAQASLHDQGRGDRASLTDLGGTNVGKTEHAVQFELKLLPVEPPQTLANAVAITPVDIRQPVLDERNPALIVAVELKRGQQQRNHAAEQEDGREKPQDHAVAKAAQRTPQRAERVENHIPPRVPGTSFSLICTRYRMTVIVSSSGGRHAGSCRRYCNG